MISVIFDRDGTIYDSRKASYLALRRILSYHSIGCPSFEEVQAIEAASDEEFWIAILGKENGWNDFEKELRRSIPAFLNHAEIIRGASVALRELHSNGITMALVSALPGTKQTKQILVRDNVHLFFKAVLTSDDIKRKVDIYTAEHYARKLALIEKALRLLKASPNNTIVVGDTATDIKVGKSLGTKTVGVLTGEGNIYELERASPNHTLLNLSELPHIAKNEICATKKKQLERKL